MGERVDDDPPSSKQVLVELDFVPADEPEMMRTRGLLIPSLRGARDVLHLEAALWALAKSDPDLQRRIREQEQIFFSSNLNFVFFAYRSESGSWYKLEKDHPITIPEWTHLRVRLERLNLKEDAKGPETTQAPMPSRLLKRKLSEEGPSKALKGGSEEEKKESDEERRRREVFEKLFFLDDDDEAERTAELIQREQEEQYHQHKPEPRSGKARPNLGESPAPGPPEDSDDDDEGRLTIDTSACREITGDSSAAETEVEVGETQGETKKKRERRLRRASQSSSTKGKEAASQGGSVVQDEERSPVPEDSSQRLVRLLQASESAAVPASSGTELDLDNDDVGVDMWKEILGIGEPEGGVQDEAGKSGDSDDSSEGEGGRAGAKESAKGDKEAREEGGEVNSTQKADPPPDPGKVIRLDLEDSTEEEEESELEDGEIRSEDEEDAAAAAKEDGCESTGSSSSSGSEGEENDERRSSSASSTASPSRRGRRRAQPGGKGRSPSGSTGRGRPWSPEQGPGPAGVSPWEAVADRPAFWDGGPPPPLPVQSSELVQPAQQPQPSLWYISSKYYNKASHRQRLQASSSRPGAPASSSYALPSSSSGRLPPPPPPPPPSGDILSASWGLRGKNSLEALHVVCSKKGWKKPIFCLHDQSTEGGYSIWKMKVLVNGKWFLAPNFNQNKGTSKQEAALVCLGELGIPVKKLHLCV